MARKAPSNDFSIIEFDYLFETFDQSVNLLLNRLKFRYPIFGGKKNKNTFVYFLLMQCILGSGFEHRFLFAPVSSSFSSELLVFSSTKLVSNPKDATQKLLVS